MHPLQYFHRNQINAQQWDDCISGACNGLIYAKSYYLDAMAENWDAIVVGDYQAVMPIPWKKKYGIAYVYPPPFLQQLGVFYAEGCVDFDMDKILRLVQSKFKFGEYYFNYSNHVKTTYTRKNFIINLAQSYSEIRANYKTDLGRDLKKAALHNLQYCKLEDYTKPIKLFQTLYGQRLTNVSGADYKRLLNLSATLNEKGEYLIREVNDNSGNLLSVSLCLIDNHRIYYLLSTTTPEGKTKLANHFLIDNLLREFSASDLIFDFEGSDIPGIAHFFKSFGAVDQPYFFYRWNNLPWPLKLFKK